MSAIALFEPRKSFDILALYKSDYYYYYYYYYSSSGLCVQRMQTDFSAAGSGKGICARPKHVLLVRRRPLLIRR